MPWFRAKFTAWLYDYARVKAEQDIRLVPDGHWLGGFLASFLNPGRDPAQKPLKI